MSDPLIPGDNPPVAPLAEAPAPAPTDRAAAEAIRAEAERVERVRLQEAIDLINVHYNAQGGPPPLPRLSCSEYVSIMSILPIVIKLVYTAVD